MANFDSGSIELTKFNNSTISGEGKNRGIFIPFNANSITEKDGRAFSNFFINEKESQFSTHFLKMSHSKENRENLDKLSKEDKQKWTPIIGNITINNTSGSSSSQSGGNPFEDSKDSETPPQQEIPQDNNAPF